MTSDPGAVPHEGRDNLSLWQLSRHDSSRENPNWEHDLVEQSRDLLCIHDLQGRLLSINPSSARLLGYTVEELLSVPMREVIPSEFRSGFDDYMQAIARDGQATGLLAVVTRSGERRIWEYRNRLHTDGVATPVVHGMAYDVTDRVQAEKALRESNNKLLETTRHQESLLRGLKLFRALIDQSNDAIEVIEPKTLRLLDVNEKECVELGYTRDELLDMTVFDIAPNATPDWIAALREQVCRNGFAVVEGMHRRKDGTTFPVELNIKHVQLDRVYVVAISRDITERKQREERLREHERVVENLEEMIAVVNRDHRYLLANSAYLRCCNLARDQVVGHPVSEIVGEETYQAIIKPNLDECFRGHVVNYERKYNCPGIGGRELAVTYLPIEGSSGIDRAACILRDVTEHKQAEDALRCSEQRYRLLFEENVAGVATSNAAGVVLHCNDAWARLLGYGTAAEIVGRQTSEFYFNLADRESLLRNFEQQGVYIGHEIQLRRKDGTPVWVMFNAALNARASEGEPWAQATAIDITERKQADEALCKSEELLRLAQEAAQIGTFERNLRTGENYWSPQMQALFGLPPGDFPKSADKFLELVHIDDRKQVKDLVDHSVEFGEAKGEWRVLWPDGSLHWISGRWRLFRDSNGNPERLIGMDFDITERKKVEEELRQAKERLSEEKLYLEKEINTELGFDDIIGQSKALKTVMESVAKVAHTDAAVLLLGETGTGKELIARAIHRLSRRASNSFVKMNCAAIPSGLLESELFGNEKGAFTGAVNKKIGRLELADKGTIFLDEVGEISLALQPKLLRVLQDQEFERLGGTQTVKVDFRLIAATNRDLNESVRENEFRSDLFYRLNVFPIRLPPLRERREDIPLLVEQFVRKCARRMNKVITSVPRKTMDALVGWNWPGNVRELENFMERSVILTTGSVLAAPLNELQSAAQTLESSDETLKAKERELILRALQQSRGLVSGPKGAAARLGLKRTTLQSKLKSLGINPRLPPPL